MLEQIGSLRRHSLLEQQTRRDEASQRRRQIRFPACARPQPVVREKTRAQSPPRSAPLPWPGRAGRAAPSARRASSQVQLTLATERHSTLPAAPQPSLSVSNTAFVISSTNSGMPSVRSMMSCRMLSGRRLVASDAVDHRVDFALAQSVDGECGHMWPSNPRRLKFRSVSDDQQHAECS